MMKIQLKKLLRFSMISLLGSALILSNAVPAFASVRIKEIAQFSGARENQLIGYGIVVGLNGTGDKGKSAFTVKSLASMLTRLGIKINSKEISVKNAAAVMITAKLPPFVKGGTKIDVTLSSLGDAKSLAGGILLQTPLQGADGIVYAVAQGPLTVGGLQGGASAETVARIPDGAIVEREVPVTMVREGYIDLLLENNDFTTCTRIAEAINLEFGQLIASPKDGGTVSIRVPDLFKKDLVKFVSKIERIEIIPDYQAKIIINERTGTIVGGKDARVSKVSLSHANINIEIESPEKEKIEDPLINTPLHSLSGYSDILFKEDEEDEEEYGSGEISVGELAQHLHSVGIESKDLISILQSIKAAGAIQAEIVII